MRKNLIFIMSEYNDYMSCFMSGQPVTQKCGNLDKLQFQHLLDSFSDESEETSSEVKKRSVEQQLLKISNECRFCGKFECMADPDEGVYVCMSCGRLNGEILDSSQEWRSLGYDDPRRSDPSRVGMPVNEHFKKASLSTSINGYGNQLFRQFHRYNVMDYDERSLLKNFQFMDNSTEDYVPEAVKDHARNLYKRVSENENKRGKKKHSNMTACVFVSSQHRHHSTNVDELCTKFGVIRKKFTKGCNFVREQLYEKEPEFYAKMKPISPEDEVLRIANILGLEEVYRNISLYVAFMVQEQGIMINSTPVSIAVGAVFLVCYIYSLGVEKKDISEKCEISDVTVNKSFNLLLSHKEYLIPTKALYDRFVELYIKSD